MAPARRRQQVLLIAFILLATFFVLNYRIAIVRGASMEPTYFDGRVILARRYPWPDRDLKRGDVVLMRHDRGIIIKRVARLPGDIIDTSYPNLLAYAQAGGLTDYFQQTSIQTPRGMQVTYTVPAGFIEVLGDNPRVSDDSRMFGPVSIRDVVGVVVGAPAGPAPLPQHPRYQTPSPGQAG
ncbi:MAG: signal peptidase I [Armatimonadetes bacterium]|nr:signal peptidase I [Armatimonadota bacterium]MDE2207716.1 signal peptidase I [Armatimonadota bacterium]